MVDGESSEVLEAGKRRAILLGLTTIFTYADKIYYSEADVHRILGAASAHTDGLGGENILVVRFRMPQKDTTDSVLRQLVDELGRTSVFSNSVTALVERAKKILK